MRRWVYGHNGVVQPLTAMVLLGTVGAVVVLLGLLGGYMLALGATLLVIAIPFVLAGLELREWLARRQAGRSEAAQAVPEVPVHRPVILPEVAGPVLPAATPRPVLVRVTQAEGVCPLGRRFYTGQTFIFTNGVTGQGLCPRAEALLRPAIERYRQGDAATGALTVMCRSPKHIVVLAIVEEAAVRPAEAKAS